MADQTGGVFDELSAKLSTHERKDLLEKLQSPDVGHDAPLFAGDAAEDTEANPQEVYSRMGLIHRLFLAIKAIFIQRDVAALVEEEMIEKVGRTIKQKCPGVFDNRSGLLGEEFKHKFEALGRGLSEINAPVKSCFGTERRAFIAFLGSAIMPILHERLMHASDPEGEGADTLDNEFELRKRVQIATREVLSEIDQGARSQVYAMYRALFFLSELVSFPLLRSAAADGFVAAQPVGSRLRGDLSDLCDTYASMRVPPSDPALSAMVVFHNRNITDEVEREATIETETAKARSAISELQTFYRAVPLHDILKILNRNPQYTPEIRGGGEDWFSHFRQYWEDRAEHNLSVWIFARRMESFHRDMLDLLSPDVPSVLEHYDPEYRYFRSATFLLSIAEKLFARRHSRTIKTFLVNGDFYKRQNREQLTDVYDTFEALPSVMREAERLLLNERNPVNSRDLPNKQTTRTDRAMEETIHKSVTYLDTLTNILNGILHGESGGAFDTVSNLNYIGGTDNRNLLGRLALAIKDFESATQLIHQIYDLENAKSAL